MPNVNDLGESKYLKKEDVDPAVVATIESYDHVNVEKDGKPPKMKYVFKFSGLDKPLVLNKTNGNRVAKITGSPDFNDWLGKTVELYNDEMVEFGGELVGGIRIRPAQGQAAQSQAAPPAETGDDIPF